MDLGYSIGVAGSIASLITLFVAAPTWRSRVVHAIYVLIVTLLAGAYVAHESRITELTATETQARAILATADFQNEGTTRGFILAALSFLEKHKNSFPDTYESAKKLSQNAGVLESKQENASDRLYQSWRLNDVGSAMKALLEGIAGAPRR